MRFCVLGSVEVAAEGRRVAFGSERQRTVLGVLLAAGGEVVSTDRLIEGLWGSRPPASAHKSLQSHLSRLRRTLASIEGGQDDALLTAVNGYRANLAACELDAADFERLVAQAQGMIRTDPHEAVQLLDQALGLWHGVAFGELADHAHVRAEARRLEQLREAAAADRVEARLALGRHEEVLGELEAVVAADPLAERVNGQLMMALYGSGHQAEALAVYRRLQQRLRDEVGIDPSAEVQALHERILRQDADLDPPRTDPLRPPRADPLRPPRADPLRPPGDVASRQQAGAGSDGAPRTEDAAPHARGAADLFGRDADLAAVVALITTTSPVTLVGTGGVGKTRLAAQVAAVVTDRFDDGVTVCALDAVRDPGSVRAALIDALEARTEGDRGEEDTLVWALGTRRVLLVLDSCEHVLTVVSPLVERILDRCPNVAVLATSREHLRVPGERVWQVAPLAVPAAGASAAEVTATPAGALFCARAEALEPTFALTDGNGPAVGELCRRLDGIPLAIELAAARVRAMTPADLLERIDQRFRLLTAGPRRDEGRHRTLHAVVAWSYELLSEAEARLFDRLAVFAGSFALAAAERVCAGDPVAEADVAGVLAELVDKSMVVVERVDDRLRYRLLDTLRDYGAARLEEAGDAARYRRAHAAHHVAVAETLGPRVRGADEGPVLAEIDAVIDDLRVAHAWLVVTGDVDGALRLPSALRDYVEHRQRDEVVTWAERALELPGARDHPVYPAALATVAHAATRRGELDRARDLAEAALAAAQPGLLATLWAVQALASAALYEGRLEDLLALADRHGAAAEQTGEDYHRALTCMARVLGCLYGGDVQTAAAHAVEYRELAERSGNRGLRASALYTHGEALLDVDPAAAAPLLEQAIETATDVDSHTQGIAMVSLASLHARGGTVDRALEMFRDVIAHWRRLGDHTHQLTTLRNLVDLLVRVGADDDAAVLYGAVTGASVPSFGAEAQRLEAAWEQLEWRLGSEAARAAVDRGRQLTSAQAVDEALAVLDGLMSG